jgi:hypothetical protein
VLPLNPRPTSMRRPLLSTTASAQSAPAATACGEAHSSTASNGFAPSRARGYRSHRLR